MLGLFCWQVLNGSGGDKPERLLDVPAKVVVPAGKRVSKQLRLHPRLFGRKRRTVCSLCCRQVQGGPGLGGML
jgi:hypothetical protein